MQMRALSVLLLAAWLPGSGVAQDSARVVAPGTSIRLHLDRRDPITGRAVSSTDSTITLRTGYGVETLRYAVIDRAQLRKGSAGKFAAIAGVTGVALGVTAAIVFKDFGCQYDGCEEDPAIAGGIFFGGAPAAIIGAFIGAFTPRWRDEPRRLSVSAPVESRAIGGAVPAANDCAPGLNGNLTVGVNTYGTGAVDGGLVINCQPARTLYLSAAFVDLPDRVNGIGDVYRTKLGRGSLGAERFVGGGIRASFSIDYYGEVGTRYMTDYYRQYYTRQHYSDRGIGAGVGLSAARRIGRTLSIRAAAQIHARPNSNRDSEKALFFGIERSARQP
jgi:hypothetical protein